MCRSRDVLQVSGRGGGTEVWSSGNVLQACRRGDVCLKSSGGTLQACRRGDVDVLLSRRAAGVGTRRRHRSMCCRRVGVELPEGMRRVLLCISRYLAFVPQDSFQNARGRFASRNPQFRTCSRVRKLNSYATLAVLLSPHQVDVREDDGFN